MQTLGGPFSGYLPHENLFGKSMVKYFGLPLAGPGSTLLFWELARLQTRPAAADPAFIGTRSPGFHGRAPISVGA